MRTKLRAVVVASVVSLISVGLTGMAAVLLLNAGLHRQANTYRPAYEANTTVLQAMTDSETGIRGYRLTNDPTFLRPYRAARSTLESALDQLSANLAGDAQLSRLVFDERRAAETWVQDYAVPAASGSKAASADEPDEIAAKAQFDSFRAVNAELGTKLRIQRDHLLDRAERLVRLTALALILVAALCIGLGLWPALRALRGLGPPLDALHETVSRIRAGDRTARADEVHGFREIQDVAIALNQLVSSDQHQRRELAEDLRLSHVVRDIALQVGHAVDLESVVSYSLQAVSSAFGTNTLWVRAFEGHGERPGRGFGAITPFREDLVPSAEIVRIARRVAEHCWQEQREVIISTRDPEGPDVLLEDEAQLVLEFVGQAGSMSLLEIPLGAGQECLGYLILTRTADDADWTPAEIDAALRVGRDIGRAVLHARLYEREHQLLAELQALEVRKGAQKETQTDTQQSPTP